MSIEEIIYQLDATARAVHDYALGDESVGGLTWRG